MRSSQEYFRYGDERVIEEKIKVQEEEPAARRFRMLAEVGRIPTESAVCFFSFFFSKIFTIFDV